MIISLDHSEEVAKNSVTFWFKVEQAINYTAGQYIEMFLPHNNPDQRGQKRWFTLSSSPTEKLIAITTKHPVNRISTFKKVLFGLQPGSKIQISEPMGDFVLPKDNTIPLLFVAGGIGITPVRSIVKMLEDNSQKRNLSIIYIAHTIDDIAFRNLFENCGATFNIFLSDEANPANLDSIMGHVTPQTLTYISGPELFVEILETKLLGAGIKPDKLVLDFYHGYSTI